MSLEIYWISGSAPAWRVIMMAEYKQLEYQSIVLETSKKQQKEPWFLDLNPRGQIPLLKHNDIVVTESLAIMHYLENQFPGSVLFGETPEDKARIEQAIFEVLNYVDKPVANVVQPIFRNKVEQFRDEMSKATQIIEKEFALLENRLDDNQWLDGPFSAIDIVLTPTIQRLSRALNQVPTADAGSLSDVWQRYPSINRWRVEIESLPCFSSSFPPHWK